MSIAEELRKYPRSGLFLQGRARHDMSEEEKRTLENFVVEVRELEHGTRWIERGTTCNMSTMLIEGFMLRTLDGEGRRYGVSCHVPGDFVDLHCFALKRLDHNIETVGPAKIGLVPHAEIGKAMSEHSHLARLFWFSTLLDAAMHREWIMKLEQLTTPRRIAHILAEIHTRLDMVGMAAPDGFDTPLTQADLADMCGATPIHTNRALSDLRKRGLLEFRHGRVRIPDRAELDAYADFDRSYLYGDGMLSLRRDNTES